MALQSQAQLLDELMGRNRNAAPGLGNNSTRFDDDDVCKYALCDFCPHDLFVNTRADLGPCMKIHDERLRKEYEKSSRYGKLGYEDDFERFIRGLLNDVERRIKRGVERLKLTQSSSVSQQQQKAAAIQQKKDRVTELYAQIGTLIAEAEKMGEAGQIDEAQSTLDEVEKLKAECKHLERLLENHSSTTNSEHKQMEVCDVCGSFLIVNDAQSRIEEHVSGKQHMGYAKLRTALEDLKKRRSKMKEKSEKERERSTSTHHHKSKSKNHDDDDSTSKSTAKKQRSISKDGHHQHHHDRDRDRHKHHRGSSVNNNKTKPAAAAAERRSKNASVSSNVSRGQSSENEMATNTNNH